MVGAKKIVCVSNGVEASSGRKKISNLKSKMFLASIIVANLQLIKDI